VPTRVQSLKYGLGSAKQVDIATIASTFNRFRKLNMDIQTLDYNTETDKDEIGKGNEFISEVFPVAWDVQGPIQKYGSAEFTLWAWAYALGQVGLAGGLYTITPIDPEVTLEPPYFSVIQQLNESGSAAIDEALLGCAIEDVTTTFNYGPGRQSLKTDCNFVGSGRHTLPSGVTLPATLSEAYMLSSSAAITINGTDYVSAKTVLNGTLGWKNNLLLNAGYFPQGSAGLVGSAAVRGRIEIGNRVPTFTFTVRLLNNSPEFAALIAQTTGTAVLTFTFDSTHTVTFTWQKVSYQMVKRTEADGIVAVTVTVAPQFDATNGILTVTGKCGIADIAQ
jgi:hypothetical protein